MATEKDKKTEIDEEGAPSLDPSALSEPPSPVEAEPPSSVVGQGLRITEGEGTGEDAPADGDGAARAAGSGDATDEDEDDDSPAAAGQLGAQRYVMAGFFVTGIAVAYVVGQSIAATWGKLADAKWFQNSVTFLARVGEEERAEYATVLGGVIAIGATLYAYRRADVRQWTDEVASELSKVTWPDKAEVTNSTVVVIVTSALATVYLALLDRFWGFVTNLVYGGSLACKAKLP